jgi:hypothetical protein
VIILSETPKKPLNSSSNNSLIDVEPFDESIGTLNSIDNSIIESTSNAGL